MKVIAHIYTDFPEKFGIPRQSGLVEGLCGKIVFEPEYRVREAFRGLEKVSHLWLLWEFSKAKRQQWSPTVRPPRLGGKKRVGVFATRSPFRPNPIGLSCVKLDRVEWDDNEGPVLWVSGVDMLDGTPIYDVKPYLAYCDSHPEAEGGFADEVKAHQLQIQCPKELGEMLDERERETIFELLSQDPRTAYMDDDEREWGMTYGEYNIKFSVEGKLLTITEITR